MKRIAGRHFFWWGAWLGIAVIYILSLNYSVQGADDAIYLVVSRALAFGQGYARPDIPGIPPEGHFPPGFPLLLAPAWWLPLSFAQKLLVFKLVSAILGLFALPILVRAVDLGLNIVHWRWLVLLAALAPFEITFASQNVMSEVSYLFSSACALWCVTRLVRQPEQERWAIVLGITLAASYYLRTVGLALIIGVVAYLVYRRQWRVSLITVAVAVVLITPWVLRNQQLEFSPVQDYGSAFLLKDYAHPELGTIDGVDDVLARLANNSVVQVTQSIPEIFFPTLTFGAAGRILGAQQSVFAGILGILCSSLMVLGCGAAVVRRGLSAVEFYLLPYLGLILLPPWVVTRNLVPIIPFLIGYLFVGIEVIVTRLARDSSSALRYGFAASPGAFLLCLFLLADRHSVLGGWWQNSGDPAARSLGAATEWIRAESGTESRLVGEFAPKLYLYSDRQAVGIERSINTDDFLVRLRAASVSYLVSQPERPHAGVYDQGEPMLLQQTLSLYPEAFELVFRSRMNPETLVYKLRQP